MNQNKEAQASDKILGVNRDIVAIIMMSCGASLITLGFTFANERKFHPFVTGVIRGLTVTCISYCLARWKQVDLTFPSAHNFKWHIFRQTIMVLQGLFYAWSLFYLPLPIAVTTYAATPIFIAIWDYLIFGMKINNRQKGWLLLATIGVALTANGGYLKTVLYGQQANSVERYLSKDPIVTLIAGILLVITQFIHALGLVCTKKLIQTNAIHVNYFVGLLLIIFNAPLISFLGKDDHYHFPNMIQLFEGIAFSGLPLAIGMFGFNGALTVSHRYGLVAPFQFAAIIVGYFVSLVRYDEEVNWFCVCGTIAIVVGVTFLLRNKDP